jgi:hypothetical protein
VNRTFDFYEYAGVLVPGAVLLIGLLWLFPEGRALLAKDGVTLGELGLFVIIAYAAGQLVQAVGNYIEWAWWKLWGGIPTAQVLGGGKYITEDQHRRIVDSVRVQGISCDPQHLERLSRAQQLAIAREVYSVVAAGKRASRVDIFSGTYGLMRGLAAAMLVLLIAAVATSKGLFTIGALGIGVLLALQRMHRFSKHYAVELFVQYLGTTARPGEGDQA